MKPDMAITVPVFDVPDSGCPNVYNSTVGRNGRPSFSACLPSFGFLLCQTLMASAEKPKAAVWILYASRA